MSSSTKPPTNNKTGDWSSTLVDLFLKLPRFGVDGPAEGVVQRHKQAEIAVPLPVVQA